uniref:Putative methyltransferase n=1 Tax=viral metagenome TaxID=1070528 RepID=A0A6M3M212_9ZZZZ
MVRYKPIKLPKGVPLNRVLDNSARELYKPAIDKLFQLVPDAMARKIPEANVQQAFVFDTICRYTKGKKAPKILCIGSFEDTACMSLKAVGYEVEEIDPSINCDLRTHFMKPTTIKGSYDVVFSTSVIEHVTLDTVFMAQVSALLKPGGMGITTCDFKEGWVPGDSKPDVDERLYTQHDLRERFLPVMSDCVLVDEPQWDCPNPDFTLIGIYQYTFATFVVKKTPRGVAK